jgi:DNA-binding GntR family transcriptional regulator
MAYDHGMERKGMASLEKRTTPQKSKIDFQSLASRIESMILTGAFKPRERLTEASLSEMFGVHRNLVRDAFKILETKGLVTFTPYKGVVVREFSRQEVEEIFAIRVTLEKFALQLSTENATPKDIKILRKMVKTIEDAHRGDDFVPMVKADASFHDYTFQLSGNNNLRRMINDLRSRCHVIRYLTWSWPNIRQQIMEEHSLIVDAIEAKNLDALNKLVEKHIYHARQSYLLRLDAEKALHDTSWQIQETNIAGNMQLPAR